MIGQGGHLIARQLKHEGVDTIFTLCGGHVFAIYDGCIDEGIRVIDVRHEQAATHAADAWGRLTGTAGVAVVTAGPGVTDAVTGVANAWRAGSPMLCIGGQGPFKMFKRGALQEMDHVALMQPITKWSDRCFETKRLPEYVSIAFRHALSGRPGPAFLEVPLDVMINAEPIDQVEFPTNYRTRAKAYGDPEYVELAVKALQRAKKPVVMAGSSVWLCRAQDALRRFVEEADLPVFLNGMGRGCMPPGHPNFFNLTRGFALDQCDVAIVIGTPLDFRLGYGKSIPSDAKIVQIDMDPLDIGHNRGIDVGIAGDVGAILGQIAKAMEEIAGPREERRHTAWIAQIREMEDKMIERLGPQLASDLTPIHPNRFSAELKKFVDRNTIVVGDGGDIVAIASKVLDVHFPGAWMDPGPLGCLGVGMPFAIAAKLARPDKRVVVLFGDGSFGLTGFEFDTAVRFHLPIIAIVGNDAAWGQMRKPQITTYGLERSIATALAPTRYDKVVEALGGYGELVTDPREIVPALNRAEASGKPACVNVMIHPKPPDLMRNPPKY
jgi:acetolactate synthase-1/2/3 large subunit